MVAACFPCPRRLEDRCQKGKSIPMIMHSGVVEQFPRLASDVFSAPNVLLFPRKQPVEECYCWRRLAMLDEPLRTAVWKRGLAYGSAPALPSKSAGNRR